MIQLLIAGVVGLAMLGGTAWQAYHMGQDSIIARQADEIRIRQQTIDDAREGAAQAIAGIQIIHQTIQGELRREIRTNTIYADCKHTPDGLRLLNDALTNRKAGPGGGGELSAASAPSR